MTFGQPLALIALVAIPALAAWYVGRRRQVAEREAAFVAPALAASVAPRRPGWRRHAPLVVFLLALSALLLALSDPRVTRAATTRDTAIILACDLSGSMGATDVAPSRIRAAERAAQRFLAAAGPHVSVGVMVFDQLPDVLVNPTTDHAAVGRALRGWKPHGGTAIGTAIQTALALLAHHGRHAAIVLLSDGGSTSGADPLGAARAAAQAHVPVDTVALGTASGRIAVHNHGRTYDVKVPPDPQLLAQIAHQSGGRSFTAASAGRLNAVYSRLGAAITHHRERYALAADLTGAALALIGLGSMLSLRWFGRLI
jgi:Ca-activated chloride channel family protein